MENKFTLASLCLLIGMGTAFAQNTQVKGNVVDENGMPVIGASIMVKGTTLGTVTDLDGNFVLEVPANGKQLEISYIGMEKQTVAVSSNVKVLLLAEERAYMFEHVCKQEQKCFYNENMHGTDWKAMTEAYRKFLPHINNNYDFAELLSELLGELNVSHTGGRFFAPLKPEATGSLGLLFNWNDTDKGLLVDEVIEKGPFDTARSKVQTGDRIEKINGQELDEKTDISQLLNGKIGEKTLVSIYRPSDGKRWDEVIKPIPAAAMNELLYRRWVKQRAADVERWSNGRLGYVHIESMDDSSFRNVYSDILAYFPFASKEKFS